MTSSIEQDLLTRMFEDDLSLARGLVAIGDYAMASESLARAIEKLHQLASLNRAASQNSTQGCEARAALGQSPIDI